MSFNVDEALSQLEDIKEQQDDEDDDGFECWQCGCTEAIEGPDHGWQCKRCGFGCNGHRIV